jgi:hypothetical protein
LLSELVVIESSRGVDVAVTSALERGVRLG